MATLTYYRHGTKETNEHDTVEEALRSAYWGEETGHISVDEVRDDDGEVVFSRPNKAVTEENIFRFCEERDYDWIADYVE